MNIIRFRSVLFTITQSAKTRKKNPISNVCQGGCMITSKAKNQRFLKFFLHSRFPLATLHSNFFQKMLILVFLRQTVHCPVKMDLFPRSSSLCTFPQTRKDLVVQLKHGKNSNFKSVFGWLQNYVPQTQRLKSTFFEKNFFTPQRPFGSTPF